MNSKPVADLLKRAGEFGARFRVSAGRVEVWGLHTLPEQIVRDLRAHSEAIRTYLAVNADISPCSKAWSELLAWSAAAAELGLETLLPVTFRPSGTEPVTTRRPGLYAAGYLTCIARIRMCRDPRHNTFTRDENQTIRSLAALREAVDRVTTTLSLLGGTEVCNARQPEEQPKDETTLPRRGE